MEMETEMELKITFTYNLLLNGAWQCSTVGLRALVSLARRSARHTHPGRARVTLDTMSSVMILVRLFFQVDANPPSLSHQMTRTWIHRLPPGPAPHHHNLPSCPPQPRVTNWPLLLTCGLRRHLPVTHRQPWVTHWPLLLTRQPRVTWRHRAWALSLRLDPQIHARCTTAKLDPGKAVEKAEDFGWMWLWSVRWTHPPLRGVSPGPRPHPWPGHRRCRWPGPGLSSSRLLPTRSRASALQFSSTV